MELLLPEPVLLQKAEAEALRLPLAEKDGSAVLLPSTVAPEEALLLPESELDLVPSPELEGQLLELPLLLAPSTLELTLTLELMEWELEAELEPTTVAEPVKLRVAELLMLEVMQLLTVPLELEEAHTEAEALADTRPEADMGPEGEREPLLLTELQPEAELLAVLDMEPLLLAVTEALLSRKVVPVGEAETPTVAPEEPEPPLGLLLPETLLLRDVLQL